MSGRGQGKESEVSWPMCLHLHLQVGETRGILDNESSYVNVELKEIQFKKEFGGLN